MLNSLVKLVFVLQSCQLCFLFLNYILEVKIINYMIIITYVRTGLVVKKINYAKSIDCSLMFCLLVSVSSLSQGTDGQKRISFTVQGKNKKNEF